MQASSISRYPKWQVAAMVVYVLLMTSILFSLLSDWAYDDLFITYRYAENLANGKGFVYVAAIAREIIRVFSRGGLTTVEWPDERKRIEIENVRISSDRLQRITGWKARYSLEEGLRKTMEILEGMKT